MSCANASAVGASFVIEPAPTLCSAPPDAGSEPRVVRNGCDVEGGWVVRVNVYNEELTGEMQLVDAEPFPGRRYIGIRFVLQSAPNLHYGPGDDDRSAVTLWFRSQTEARVYLKAAAHLLDES
jgi:hypothetical protein